MRVRLIRFRKLSPLKRTIAIFLLVVLLAGIFAVIFKPGKAAADIAFVSQTTASKGTASTSSVINAPASIVANNLLVVHLSSNSSSFTTLAVTTPAGWVHVGSQLKTGRYYDNVYYKIATASEPSSYTFTFNVSSTTLMGIVQFSGVDKTNPLDTQGGQTNSSSTTQTAPSVTASFSNDMVLPLFTYGAARTANSTPAGVTTMWQATTASVGYYGGYEAFGSAGSTGTFQTTTSSGQVSAAHTVAFKAAGAAIGIKFVAASTPVSCTGCTSLSPAAPTGWKAGDFFLTSVSWSAAVTLTPPSGWTQIDTTNTQGTYSQAEFYHFAVTGDPSSYTWGFSGSTRSVIGTADYSGVDPDNPIDVTAQDNDASSSSTHIAPSVTTNYAQDMLVVCWVYTTGATTSSQTATMTRDWTTRSGSGGGNVGDTEAHEIIGTAGATGTRSATSSSTNTAMEHSIALKPFIPTPQLLAPVDGSTDTSLSPVFQMVNESINDTPLEYKIHICSNNDCSTVVQSIDQSLSQTGWSGQDANSGTAYFGSSTPGGSTTATYTEQTPLSPGTTYYWVAYSYDPTTGTFSLPSNVASFTTSALPAAPTLYAPPNGTLGTQLDPEFQLASTDADGDNLQYKIDLCSTSNCSSIIQTFDETTNQTGWSGQDSDGFTTYAADTADPTQSTQAYYRIQYDLTPGTTYYWRAYAIDPAGTNSWSSASSIFSFKPNPETRILNGTIKSGKIL